jgi:hypothetical protein
MRAGSLVLYVRCVFRHWCASMAGFAALVLGAAIRSQWGLTRWIRPDSAEFWWFIGSACLCVATFQAWLDEHRERIRAEWQGPTLVLEFREDERHGHHWRITNTGQADAVNVISDDITVGDDATSIERIALLQRGQSAEVSFNQRVGGNPIGHARHPSYVLDESVKTEVGRQYGAAEFVERLADSRLPIRLTYFDPAGVEYESRGMIRWNGVRQRGYVEPVSWGVAASRNRRSRST